MKMTRTIIAWKYITEVMLELVNKIGGGVFPVLR